jgi:hypothetical protein
MDANEKAKNTVGQSVTPTFMPTDGEVMTLIIDYPPGDPGLPPHRHPGGPRAAPNAVLKLLSRSRRLRAKATAEELIAHCGAVRRVYGAE